MKNGVSFYLEFIKEVEKHPPLYDKNRPEYVNRRKTDAIWSRIAAKFNTNLSTIKSKWKVIRSSYVRSLTTTEKNGAKEYYLAKYLNFLKDFIQIRGPQRLRTPNESDEEEVVDFKNVELLQLESDDEFNDEKPIEEILFDPMPPQTSETGSSKPSGSQKRIHLDDDDDGPMEYIKRARVDDAELSEEPCRMFMLSLVQHMKSMTPQQQLSFQKRVIEAIEDIKYGQPSHSRTQ